MSAPEALPPGLRCLGSVCLNFDPLCPFFNQPEARELGEGPHRTKVCGLSGESFCPTNWTPPDHLITCSPSLVFAPGDRQEKEKNSCIGVVFARFPAQRNTLTSPMRQQPSTMSQHGSRHQLIIVGQCQGPWCGMRRLRWWWTHACSTGSVLSSGYSILLFQSQEPSSSILWTEEGSLVTLVVGATFLLEDATTSSPDNSWGPSLCLIGKNEIGRERLSTTGKEKALSENFPVLGHHIAPLDLCV